MEYGGLTAATTTDYLDDLFSSQTTEVDVGMEWLSVFVEDCFSSGGNCLPAPAAGKPTSDAAEKPSSQQLPSKPLSAISSLQQFAVAGKARSKRKRVAAAESRRAPPSTWFLPSSDPPLLDVQAYWMADSELLGPRPELERHAPEKERNAPEQERNAPEQERHAPELERHAPEKEEEEEEREEEEEKVAWKGKRVILAKNKVVAGAAEGAAAARRCSHCLSQRTPQWRAGPMGPKTLCNACGVRYKSGRLLPEYRPAKSPTFVSYLHSNSHRKVLEMRGSGAGVGGGGGGVSTAENA